MNFSNIKGKAFLLLPLLMCFMPSLVQADELNGADTAWILTSTALVLFMTIPGLALFYAGLVVFAGCILVAVADLLRTPKGARSAD